MTVVRDLSPQEVKDLKQNRERLKFDEKHEGQRELTNDEVKAMEEFIASLNIGGRLGKIKRIVKTNGWNFRDWLTYAYHKQRLGRKTRELHRKLLTQTMPRAVLRMSIKPYLVIAISFKLSANTWVMHATCM